MEDQLKSIVGRTGYENYLINDYFFFVNGVIQVEAVIAV